MTVLKSLDDLIEEAKAEGKQPWELKLWALGFGSECYFTPYFKDKLDCWYGVREDNSAIKYIDTNSLK